MLPDNSSPVFSVVVPVYNEQEVLPIFHERLVSVMSDMGEAWEVIYVDDGSHDLSLALLKEFSKADPRQNRYVSLSRNFGKEIAMTAGLDCTKGQAVIIIDADLQDPPELIPQLAAEWRLGYDIVYAQRTHRDGETWLKKATAKAFYRVMQRVGGRVRLPEDTGDFRLMSRRSVDALNSLRERHRFMKGLFAWVGFPSKAVPYRRDARAAGVTKWNYLKLIDLSIEGITSFTTAPLRLATWCGIFAALAAVAYATFIVIQTLLLGNAVPGYPSLITIVLFLGGIQLFTLGVLGEYLGRIFNETKARPLYFVKEVEKVEMES